MVTVVNKQQSGQLDITDQTIPNGETGDIVWIQERSASVALNPKTGSAKLQYTLSRPSVVEANAALWFDWGYGTVSAPASDVIAYPVTAVRAISISGEVGLEVVQ